MVVLNRKFLKPQSSPLLLLIQDPATGMYLGAAGQWVPDEADAKVFGNPLTLYNYCHSHSLGHVQIVFKEKHQPRGHAVAKAPFEAIMG